MEITQAVGEYMIPKVTFQTYILNIPSYKVFLYFYEYSQWSYCLYNIVVNFGKYFSKFSYSR